jgi:AsmA protein
MTYRFKDNRLDLKGTGNAGKGDFDLKTLIDLSKSGYSYDASGKINSLYLEEIVKTFLPKAKDTLFGILTTNFSLNGKGTLPHNIKRNLAADGDFNIKNGKISTIELTKKLSQLLKLSELETIEFTKAEGTFNVKNGTAVIDSLFQSDKLAMDPKGNIGLVDETLDLAFNLKLSPRLTKKTMGSSISQYIRDQEGWGTVPLLVTGTFSKPKYKIEVKKVGKKIIETEINKLLEKLWGN